MKVEVVYMVGHSDEPHQTRGYRRRNEVGPASSKTTTSQEDQAQYEQLEEEVPSGDGQNDDQEEEVLAETLAQAQRRLKFQLKEKDKEISKLNSKMTEMMAQMTAMMQLMQKNIITNPALTQPADHQSSIPTNLPTNPIPQVPGIRTTHEEENEADQLVHLQTHQNIASASEPELLDRIAKFEKLNLSKPEYHSDRPRRNKAVDTRRDEVYSASSLRIDKEKQCTPKDDKGKQYTNHRPQPKLILGGNDTSQTFRDGGERSKLRTGASTSRSLTWRRSNTKRFYKTSSKKSGNSNKHNKLKKKRTVLQKIINNLKDYRQPMRQPIMLADFMSELQIDPSEVEDDEQEDEELLHVETCRVISIASTAYQKDSIKNHDRGQIAISPTKMTDKMTSESCLMVLQTDDNSEEKLYFPSDKSDQKIASQMEHTKLNEDSEHTTKTSSDEAESNEVDQVQLRSGNMIKGKEKSNVSLRRDLSWKYSIQVDVGGVKTYVYLKCNFYGKVVKGGVTRMKEHLSSSHKNVAPCANVPDKVKDEIAAYMKKSTTIKYLQQEQFDERVDQGAYYGSESGKGSSSTINN
ncbi:hypothetical protein M5K25_017779 [Dendrobium thyrsiflorum]|uniref:BED-type domain-containing protein n=1 Tax=Dendrobium thyrsiflorum TaxID=117978 RepID=A0ABD0UGF3_DENTH